MTGKHETQPLASSLQDQQGTVDGSRRLRQLLGVGPEDLLTTHDVARDYRFPSPEAVRQYLRRWEVPYQRRGRVVLVERRDFEASMSKSRKLALVAKRA